MADAGAWQAGLQIGGERAQERRAHKQALSDEELQGKINDLIGQRSALVSKISTLDKDTPEYNQAFDALKQVNSGLVSVYHPDKNPSAISRFGHLLTDHLGIKVNGETLPQRRKEKADKLAAQKDKTATSQTQQEVAGAPLSPAEEATGKAKADLVTIQSAMKNFQTLNPNATPEEKQSFLTDLIQKTYGTTIRGNWTNIAGKMNGQSVTLLFDKATRQYRLQNGEAVPEEMLATFTPDTKTTEVDRERQEYDEAVKNGYKGSFIQYKTEEAAKGRNAAPKPQTADQQEQAILRKQALGQPLTPEEVASLKAYKEWIKIKTTDPKVAGYQALAWSRIQQVEVPGSPGETTYVPAGIAFKNNMKAPNSLSHLMTIYYGTGKGGQDLLRFNTATHHLGLLRNAADALNNDNIPLFNQYANQYASATGNPEPTNFNAIRSAVVDEMERLYTGVGATQEGILAMKADINNAESPDQMTGYINTDLSLMHGKIESSAQQYIMGTEGVPAFPADIVPPPPSTPAARGGPPAATGGKPKNAIGKVAHGNKNYWVDAQGNNLGVAP